MKPKVLVVSYNVPRPDKSSGELRFVSILEMLVEFWEIDFCVAPTPNTDWRISGEVIHNMDLLSGKGIRVLPAARSAFKNAIRNTAYSGAYFNQFWVAECTMPKFIRSQPGAFTVVDSVDVQYAREESQAELGELSRSRVEATKARELGVYRAADCVIAVSSEDFRLLTDVSGLGKVLLIPNIVREFPRFSGDRGPVVVFIGCYAWYPNPDAVKWFAREIWPVVREAVPDAEFLVIGSDLTEEVSALSGIPGIKVTGYVPDTKPYLDRAAVSVAPLRVGGGMKGKVNEAMAHGVPVVATTIGAQGFGAENGKEMMIADDPQEFASCVITLLTDDKLQRDMGLAGQRLNSGLCSGEAVKRQIGALADFCASLNPDRLRVKPGSIKPRGSTMRLVLRGLGHGIRLLRREGPGPFIRRCYNNIHGRQKE